jgi:hypothetical protein
MATVDLEAIRRRVRELNGEERRRTSNVQLWKPKPGKYRIRGVPWKDASPEAPLKELYFYYLGDRQGMLTLQQFGKPDPINEMLRKLYKTGKADDREIAKKMQPKMRAYMLIMVRGEEDKGLQVWSLGKMLYQRILNFWLDDELQADILDPDGGFDLIVNVTQTPGKEFLDYTVDAARASTPLHTDKEVVQKWLVDQPSLKDLYREKSYAEVEKELNEWLNGGPIPVDVQSSGITRGVDHDVVETPKPVVEAPAKPKAEKPALRAQKPRVDVADVDDVVDVKASTKKSLDDAFNELLDN